eukprot:UC4_evm1s706
MGVVLWEIETLGCKPYEGIPNHEVYSWVSRGKRLDRPQPCQTHTHETPKLLYDLMCHCWSHDPLSRPSFKLLHKVLFCYCERTFGYIEPAWRNTIKSDEDIVRVKKQLREELEDEYFTPDPICPDVLSDVMNELHDFAD